MLKDNILWTKHKQFKSGTENEPIEFFSDCLRYSTRFDLMLGFFSSTAIQTLYCGFSTFLYNHGKMRLIINNILSEHDKKALNEGLEVSYFDTFDLSNIEEIRSTLSKRDEYFFKCLSWLISKKRIEIKIIAPKGKVGISHTKSGVFKDKVNTIAFNGSCNFSKTALIDNIESIDAYCCWDGKVIEAKIDNIQNSFERVFSGNDPTVRYVDPNDIETSICSNFPNITLSEIYKLEQELYDVEIDSDIRPTVRRALIKAQSHLEKKIEKINFEKSLPKFPYEQPRNYQVQAYLNWLCNGKKGLFAMATGTGKTITSLNCLYEIYKETGFYKAVILVPTIALVEQWEEECRKFNFINNIIKACSTSNWKSLLGGLETLRLIGKEASYIIISTYASFLKPKFQYEFKKLTSDTLLIADEAHSLGAPGLLKKLKNIHLENRIGLSATPERQNQEEINNAINHFFNEHKDKFTFEFTMHEAIKGESRALCSYRYYPKLVKLTENEFNKYVELTRKISTFKPKSKEEDEIFKLLTLKRQRIIHKAENKVSVFNEILKEEFHSKGDLKYTLVYAPEGLGDYDTVFDSSKTDKMLESESDRNILNHYTKLVSNIHPDVTVKQFTGNTPLSDRMEILEDFSSGKIQVLTSMKCLDEGVDIPRAELAIFCASTGNPRQFIQRRGRVLRQHPSKHQARIYDLVVIPERSNDPGLFNIERNEVNKELKRIRDFAKMSDNHYESIKIFDEILQYYQLTL